MKRIKSFIPTIRRFFIKGINDIYCCNKLRTTSHDAVAFSPVRSNGTLITIIYRHSFLFLAKRALFKRETRRAIILNAVPGQAVAIRSFAK